MSISDVTEQGPITVIIKRRIQAGREGEFETWLSGLSIEALKFPGHLGLNVIRPTNPKQPEYVLIFRFDGYENLRNWEESEVRQAWLARIAPLTIGEADIQQVTGLEFWFTPSSAITAPVPPRWKMVIVTCVAFYPVVNIMRLLFFPLTGGMSPWLGTLLTMPFSISLMTYLIMPLTTRLFSRWLYKARIT